MTRVADAPIPPAPKGTTIVGVDETGRGSCFGPIVTCAVAFPAGGLDAALAAALGDSKALTARRREAVAAALPGAGALHAFGAASAAEVDLINPLRATMLAMARAVRRLGLPNPFILVDGPYMPDMPHPGAALVRGDQRVAEIMAASILAKVHRDALLARLAARHPGYGLERHAGYLTAAHSAAILRLGATRHHRSTFIRRVGADLAA